MDAMEQWDASFEQLKKDCAAAGVVVEDNALEVDREGEILRLEKENTALRHRCNWLEDAKETSDRQVERLKKIIDGEFMKEFLRAFIATAPLGKVASPPFGWDAIELVKDEEKEALRKEKAVCP